MIEVVFGADIFGDHTARPSRIIDTERRNFKTLNEALSFASECTECINVDQLKKLRVASTVDLPIDLQAESLLLNLAEFTVYRE